MSACAGIPMRAIASAVPRVARIRKPFSCRRSAIAKAPALSASVTEMKTVPCNGSGQPAAACALANAVGKSRAIPITSPVERISGPSTASEPSKRSNGSTASLTETWSPKPSPSRSRGRCSAAIDSPSITRQASFASGRPTALETNGTVREARGLASITYSCAVDDGVLHVQQPHHADRQRELARGGANLIEHLPPQRVRRQHAGGVAGVHAGLLHVLHDPPDPHLPPVAQRVDVQLDRVLQEAVEEDLAGVLAHLAAQIVGQALARVDDLHRAAPST